MASLSRKIGLSILLTCGLVTLIFGALLTFYELHRRDVRQEQTRILLAAVYEQRREDLANEVFGGKTLALGETFAEMQTTPGVLAVSVYGLDGKLILTSGRGLAERLSPDEMAAVNEAPSFATATDAAEPSLVYATAIEVIGERVGYLRLHYAKTELIQETRVTVLFFVVMLFALLLVTSLTLNSLLSRLVIRPVVALKEAMARVGQGRLEARVEVKARDAIGEMAASFNDMTAALRQAREERDAAMTRLTESLDELSRKAAELEEANLRLTELDRLKSDFLSSVSHELRTPLTSVRGFAKLIRRDFLKAFKPEALPDSAAAETVEMARRIEHNLAIIVEESERLSSMIDDVLDLAKIESGKLAWRDRLFNLAELAERAVRATAGLYAMSPEISLSVAVEAGLPQVNADPDRLLQVLINLLANAAKFTPRGLVTLSAGLAGGALRVTVADQGVGIAPEELKRIFDQFYQALPGEFLENKIRGTGLGLAISRHIVEHYNGRIWAESEPGRGSAFHFELPASRLGRSRPRSG